jgi:DNA-binding HxlR family transcriptional regulator
MSSRSYSQFCGVAAAMDVLGERWAALVVRNLLDGPQRYTDLLNGLPGVSTDMLASRLNELERVGVVQRSVLPPPAASKVYELTELGRELEPVIHALARWGIRRLVAGGYDDSTLDPRWIELALRASFSTAHAPRRKTRVRFVLGDDSFVVIVSRSGLAVEPPSAGVDDDDVDVEVTGSPKRLAELLVDPESLAKRTRDKSVRLSGSDEDVAAALASFRLDP